MKRIFALCALLAGFMAASAQGTVSVTPDPLVLKETEHDFGQIPKGKPVFYNFSVKNTGSTPLRLDDVHASCGCTTPEWNHDPIAPGGTATIKVGFNAASEGAFTKPITITYNSGTTQQLTIKGFVWKAPEGAAPPNAAVNFLKKQTL